MRLDEIRTSFIKYFNSKGHETVKSSSLVPKNDPTLLFANAGMNQFKDLFLGKEKRSYVRAASVQKCVRAGGKHNDLENVGFTARHHTFFEMLGNFSFGDYFKEDAIQYAWQFTTEVLRLDKTKIFVTVFHTDEEARKIWIERAGVEPSHVFGMGEKDNFWQMGDTGPCGPCTELFFDRGESFCKKPAAEHFIADGSGCDCDRYTEFWNLVFMQYDRQADGKLVPLPKPSVDTGAGLERLASILQGVDSNYDTDHFCKIIDFAQSLLGKQVPLKDRASVRVIADHARASAFLIADGVLPSNEGRGYVLRRMIRRAVRHGKNLGFNEPFLGKVALKVVELMKDVYPELAEEHQLIGKCLFAEEEQFLSTIEKGMHLLSSEIQKLPASRLLSGEVAFKLYDTFGFPLDLTALICKENQATVDEKSFDILMEEQKTRSRLNWKGSGEQNVGDTYRRLLEELNAEGKSVKFEGYTKLSLEAVCIAAWPLPSQDTENLIFECVFDRTCFYAESGGQVGDKGTIESIQSGRMLKAEVIDSQKPVGDLIVHRVRVSQGELVVGSTYRLIVDKDLRAAAEKNHTATHLLNYALRKHLGEHVKQAGSLVTAENLRFDFTHFEGVTAETLTEIEKTVNQLIWQDSAVDKREMAKEEALKLGAVAMFGEKYGDFVRVVSAGSESVEFCGGTHIERTSQIHLFKILSESSVAAGVRRIVALTGKSAFEYLSERDHEIRTIRQHTNSNGAADIIDKFDKQSAELKDLRKKISDFAVDQIVADLIKFSRTANLKTTSGHKLVTALVKPTEFDAKAYRSAVERCVAESEDCLFVILSESAEEDKVSLLVGSSKNISKALSAKSVLAQLAAVIGGKGGGNDLVAQAGGNQRGKVEMVFKKAETL